MANVFEKARDSIKSVINSFLEDDNESETDIRTLLLKESKDGDLSPEEALELANAFSSSNKRAIEFRDIQESFGKKTKKKSQKKYTTGKDSSKEVGKIIQEKDRSRER